MRYYDARRERCKNCGACGPLELPLRPCQLASSVCVFDRHGLANVLIPVCLELLHGDLQSIQTTNFGHIFISFEAIDQIFSSESSAQGSANILYLCDGRDTPRAVVDRRNLHCRELFRMDSHFWLMPDMATPPPRMNSHLCT